MKNATFCCIAFLTLSAVAPLQAQLLPAAPPYTLQSLYPGVPARIRLQINTYTSGPTNFNVAQVVCPNTGQNIGSLAFQYATWTGDPTGGNANTAGGAIINGGFTANAAGTAALPAGCSYQWLQYINVTTVTNVGMANQMTTTVNQVDGNPLYPARAGTMAAGTLNFTNVLFDAPGRSPAANTTVTWRAESALVCFCPARTIMVIGSFTWGFNLSVNAMGTVTTNAMNTAPANWGNASAAFYNGFNAEYGPNGTNANNGWTISQGCCVVPEFSTMALLLLCTLIVLLQIRRQRVAACRIIA